MPIQFFAFRDDKCIDLNFTAPSVEELFQHTESYIQQVAETERWNLYYTLAECFPGPGRRLEVQRVVGFDIDDVPPDQKDEALEVVLEALRLEYEDCIIVDSGNGLQVVAKLDQPFTTREFYQNNKKLYNRACDKIDEALKVAGIEGAHADRVVWSPARLFRLPFTRNIKNGQEKLSTLINNTLGKTFSFSDYVTRLEKLPPPSKVLDKLPAIDVEAVRAKCGFVKYGFDEPEKLSEPQWYAWIDLVARFPNGRALIHEASKKHPNYSYDETEKKIDHALDGSHGPRTCQNIATLWDGCPACPQFGKVKTPLLIKGDEFIATEKCGFWTFKDDKPYKPAYQDLEKFFRRQHDYIVCQGSLFLYNGTHWEADRDPEYLNNFIESHLRPEPNSNHCNEFSKLIKRKNRPTPVEFFQQGQRRINFKNGVLDIETMQLLDHDRNYGFRYVLPYDYDPDAKCPHFDKFLNEVTCGRDELITVLWEFIGYCAANEDPIKYQKALFLLGEGSNGKSTFTNIITKVLGSENVSKMPFAEICKDKNARGDLEGKLVNISEETAKDSLLDSTFFKSVVDGSEIHVRLLWKNGFTYKNHTKMILLVNEMPYSYDSTHALMRRPIIIPFDATFSAESGNKDIDILERMDGELSGIMNKALVGYKRLVSQKEFSIGAIIKAQLESYNNEIDKTRDFAEEMLDISDNFDEFSDLRVNIYAAYVRYCEEAGIKKVEHREAFFKKLRRHIPKYDERISRPRSSSNIKRPWVIRGVRVAFHGDPMTRLRVLQEYD